MIAFLNCEFLCAIRIYGSFRMSSKQGRTHTHIPIHTHTLTMKSHIKCVFGFVEMEEQLNDWFSSPMAEFRLSLYYMKYNSWLCFPMDFPHHKFLIGQGFSHFFSLELYTNVYLQCMLMMPFDLVVIVVKWIGIPISNVRVLISLAFFFSTPRKIHINFIVFSKLQIILHIKSSTHK